MDALVHMVVQNTNICFEQAERAVEVVIYVLKQRLPSPFPDLISQAISGENLLEKPGNHHAPKGQWTQPTFHLAGLTKDEFEESVNDDDLKTRCMVCGRRHGEELIAFGKDNEIFTLLVEIIRLKRRFDTYVVSYPICKTCTGLLSQFSNR